VPDVDHSEQAVVISVVYHGPPEAGKTTTLRTLARGFGREVYTPEERDGRTVHFDWLEHIGGRFEGSPIRCQIVSVPRLDVGADRAGPTERAGTRPPSHDAPCGFVWPPIEGRILLRDAAPPSWSPVYVGLMPAPVGRVERR
jgi:hypothetical protein